MPERAYVARPFEAFDYLIHRPIDLPGGYCLIPDGQGLASWNLTGHGEPVRGPLDDLIAALDGLVSPKDIVSRIRADLGFAIPWYHERVPEPHILDVLDKAFPSDGHARLRILSQNEDTPRDHINDVLEIIAQNHYTILKTPLRGIATFQQTRLAYAVVNNGDVVIHKMTEGRFIGDRAQTEMFRFTAAPGETWQSGGEQNFAYYFTSLINIPERAGLDLSVAKKHTERLHSRLGVLRTLRA